MKRFLLLTLAAGTLGAGGGMAAEKPVVVIDTSMGKIKVELYQDKAPVTVKNFLRYVDDKFYDGTIFHRVIANFMVQAGGFDTKGKEKDTHAAIKNEASNGLSNERGTVAMARTNDPNSATSQFFINLKDNSFLDKANDPRGAGYCVFGKVVDGMDVVDKIGSVQTGKKSMIVQSGQEVPFSDVPLQEIVMKSIRLQK